MTALLDVNALIALAWPNHIHHARARGWFAERSGANWATCPLTQIAFVRISSNPKIIADAVSPMEALNVLAQYTEGDSHFFITDDVDLSGKQDIPVRLLHGYRQVTDFYLLLLARNNDAMLVTLDGKLVNAVQGTEFENCTLNPLVL